MEKESFLGTIVAVVMATIILSVVLVPIVDAESSYYVGVDENNENSLTDMMFTYTEEPVTKNYSIYWNNNSSPGIYRISGDYEYSGSLGTEQILMGTDNWGIVVSNNLIVEVFDGVAIPMMSAGSGTFDVSITNGIPERQTTPYKYLYYPDEFGVYANYSSYVYDTDDAYSIGSFAGISAITKKGEIQNETAFDMTADVLYDDETNEYTGVEFYPAPEPEPEEESVEESIEVHAAYDGSLGAAVSSVGSPNPVAVENVSGGMVLNAATNPSNATLVGDLWYDVRSGNAIVVGVRDSSLTQIVIPSSVTVNGTSYTVVAVANSGNQGPFQNMTSLVSLTIPDTLTHFGGIDPRTGAEHSPTTTYQDFICRGCTSLSTFSFGSSSNLQYLGDYVFYECTNLNLSSLPSSVRVIGSGAFNNCPNVTISSLSSQIEYVKGLAFANTGCTTFTFPNNEVSIGGSLFRGCVNLTSVVLPNGMTAIPSELFSGCTSLTTVNIPSTVTSIGAQAFNNCPNLTLSSLPTTMTEIGQYAFTKCSSITLALLPYGLTTIGNSTFDGCTNVTFSSIPDTVTSIGNYAFRGCTNVTFATLPGNLTSIGTHAFDNCTRMTLIEIPNGVTSIGNGAFYRCSSILVSEIPDGITRLGNDTFASCTSIRTMDLNNVELIGQGSGNYGTFYGCTSLTQVTGHKLQYVGYVYNVTQYGSSDFQNCTSLRSVDFPIITAIGDGAFNGSGLTIADFPTVTYLGSNVFRNCANLQTANLPLVTSAKGTVFENCSSLVSCNLPLLTELGTSFFDGCTNLKTLTIGTLTSVRERAFYYCSNLESTIDCSGCATIYDYVFFGCSKLPAVLLGEGLQSIGRQAFYNCSSLVISEEEPIYASTIGGEAFRGCVSIQSLYLVNVSSLPADSSYGIFEGCTSLTKVILPNATIIGGGTTYTGARGPFNGCTSMEYIEAPKLETLGFAAFRGMKAIDTSQFRNVTFIDTKAFDFADALNITTPIYIGPKVETVSAKMTGDIYYLHVPIIIEGDPVIADNVFGTLGYSYPKIVVLGNPTFQGNLWSSNANARSIEILNYGDVPIYAGSHGLPANKTVIKEKLEDVSMLQIKDHIGYYKHYKEDIEYKLLLIVPIFVGLGIVMALFSPAIRSRLT